MKKMEKLNKKINKIPTFPTVFSRPPNPPHPRLPNRRTTSKTLRRALRNRHLSNQRTVNPVIRNR